ncbi:MULTISPECIES: SDR family oxidoreductase [Variovorax]|jgi:NAD(P)-dependent dehydrogenase (short-subunit alcohol dehydrogenase family)|uniref:NAD(P)-dependent dehydrogenase (Short-subunit alcohol dehydrogenase family) n=1 Tax=Variovorax paradoxus TaxID=34073 RepID=A0AAE3XYQ7_VARPD|nr:SDR family oxidoreductase [Variovorax paradoxus]MDR6428023.1 NAD(P)-dependent dehydrogenase (short-subunit alcohol dehydrogenase family) [Variovorax paradoxus]
MSKRFQNKVVIATGAASGLGLATARMFVEEGARVVLVDLNEAEVTEAARQLREEGGDAEAVVGDVSDARTVKAAVTAATKHVDRVDVLFNNAAIDPWNATSLEETNAETWHQVIDVNLKSAYMFIQAVLPFMRKAGGGAIVNTASTAGLKASPRESVYGISKAALVQMTKSVARDHAREGIRSNCICPGFLEKVMTDRREDMTDELLARRSERASGLVPMGREGRYEEVARAVLFLADSNDSSYITGASLVIDGGFTLV